MRNKTLINTGNCGEYYVAAQLEQRGFSTAIPMSNNPMFDILAQDRATEKLFSIQVKTTDKKTSRWILNKKVENIKNTKDMFFIFVKLVDYDVQLYYIVPAEEVKRFCIEDHQKWLNTPGKNGQAHVSTDMRAFVDLENKWLNRWDLIV